MNKIHFTEKSNYRYRNFVYYQHRQLGGKNFFPENRYYDQNSFNQRSQLHLFNKGQANRYKNQSKLNFIFLLSIIYFLSIFYTTIAEV